MSERSIFELCAEIKALGEALEDARAKQDPLAQVISDIFQEQRRFADRIESERKRT